MNTFDPMSFWNAFQPRQATATATGYARMMMTELEKQAERWAEYGVGQATEGQKLFRTLQSQAFAIGKSMLDAADQAFEKAGS